MNALERYPDETSFTRQQLCQIIGLRNFIIVGERSATAVGSSKMYNELTEPYYKPTIDALTSGMPPEFVLETQRACKQSCLHEITCLHCKKILVGLKNEHE